MILRRVFVASYSRYQRLGFRLEIAFSKGQFFANYRAELKIYVSQTD